MAAVEGNGAAEVEALQQQVDLAAAREARETAREAREIAREAREIYTHRADKVKDVLHPPVLVLAILYPLIIGFTLQARGWHFSLVHPFPFGDDVSKNLRLHGPDQWVTFNPVVFIRTVGSFIIYTMVHVCFAAQMRIHGKDVPKLAPVFACVTPIVLMGVGLEYFYTYASLSRYSVHISDWIAMGLASLLVVIFTGFLIWAPLATVNLIEGLFPDLDKKKDRAGDGAARAEA